MQPRLVAAACVLVTTIPGTASIQDSPDSHRRWWRAQAIQRHIRLTSRQVATLDAIFERRLPERIDRHRQIQELDRRLARIMEDPASDDDMVVGLSAELEALRAEQNIRRTLMLFAMYQTLTDEQRIRLKQMHRVGHTASPRETESR
jgi:Spy/CpxP family protein refolding chaperone